MMEINYLLKIQRSRHRLADSLVKANVLVGALKGGKRPRPNLSQRISSALGITLLNDI